MNLITYPWVWVVRKDGTRQKIALSQINTQYKTNPVLRIDFPRVDFNASATQLIIAFFQTFFAPREKNWKKLLNSPIKSQEILGLSDIHAFDLDGEGPRFMQDLTSEDLTKDKKVSYLLIESPGETTVKEHKDFFHTDGAVDTLCPSCAAVALFIRQSNSFPAGQGYKTAIRVGKSTPVNCHIVGDTLWETIVYNCLTVEEKGALGGTPEGPVFPWTLPTVDSSGSAEKRATISLKDMNPCYPLWEMPSRLHLIFESTSDCCDICGSNDSQMVKRLKTVGDGNCCVDKHHFYTPYTEKKGNKIFTSLYSTDSRMTYVSLVNYLLGDEEAKKFPAPVIQSFLKRGISGAKLWAFGYMMENAKFFGWTEHTWTIPDVTERVSICRLASIAKKVAFRLEYSVRQMLQTFSDIKGKKGMPHIQEAFYKKTAQAFYTAVKNPDLHMWLQILVMKAFEVFDMYVGRQKLGLQVYTKRAFIERVNTKIAKELDLPLLDAEKFVKTPSSSKKTAVSRKFFDKELSGRILSWYGKQLKHTETHALYTRCMSVDDVTELKNFQAFIDPFMVDLKVNGFSDYVIRDRMALAFMILSRIDSSKVDLSETFPAQMAKINARHATRLFHIKDPLKEWRAFEDIIRILPHVNILSFIEGFVHWGTDIKCYWARVFQAVNKTT